MKTVKGQDVEGHLVGTVAEGRIGPRLNPAPCHNTNIYVNSSI
jgi:hypothetical protein